MKVRVLYPSAFQTMEDPPAGGDVITVSDDDAKAFIAAGYAEEVAPKVERATKAPGEKRAVARPKKAEE